MSAEIRFGTDGWRGVIADDFTFPALRRVARATARYIRRETPGTPLVLVGYDRRFFSPSFAASVARVLRQVGLNVRLSTEPMPTPAMSLCVTRLSAAWGLMITASHNPAIYNGFKIKDGSGRSAPPEVTAAVEGLLSEEPVPEPADTPAIETFRYRPLYERYLRRRLDWDALKTLRGTVVFDHLHGVGAGLPESLLAGTALKVESLHGAPDVLFGGLHPEPIEAYLGDLKAAVRRRRALLGVALDGDADRLGIVDDRGRYLTPHQVFPLLALHCIEHKKWRGKIVQSVSLGVLGERIAKAYGLPFEEVPVGFKHVADRMLREDVMAGGEESGGYAVRGGLPERDGVLSGLLFLEMIAARRKKPSELLAEMEKRFGRARFHRIDLPLPAAIPDKAAFTRAVAAALPPRLLGVPVVETRTADGLKVVLANGAWVLLRPSGTEPLVRTYAESESPRTTARLLAFARQTVEATFSCR